MISCQKTNNNSQTKPPPSPSYIGHTTLQEEVDSLEELRKVKIEDLVCSISKFCSLNRYDSLVAQLTVTPNGEIVDYNLIKRNSLSQEIISCIEKVITKSENLGIIKVIPTARTGRIPQTILYTVPIRDNDFCKE